MRLWTVGYGAWPASVRASRMVEALRAEGITRLVDVRINPCSSNLEPEHHYGPRPWNLQVGNAGIGGLLQGAGIAYEWLVELGNPQRQDPSMAVLKAHLADPEGDWPVHRGLERLAAIVRRRDESTAILCACAKAAGCHRSVVARALSERHFDGALEIRHVGEARGRA